jgi:hypothetical protein
MVDDVTVTGDVQTPDNWTQYTMEQAIASNRLVQSGVINVLPFSPSTSGGTTVNVPNWTFLVGDESNYDDSGDLDVDDLQTGLQVSPIIGRSKGFAITDASIDLAGSNPSSTMTSKFATYWDEKLNVALINLLEGVFGAAGMSGNVLDITGDSPSDSLTSSTLVDAQKLLGDQGSKLMTLIGHSDVHGQLVKDELITYLRNSEVNANQGEFNGKVFVQDDALAPVATVYTTYLVGAGAVGLRDLGVVTPEEVQREARINGGQNEFIQRRRFMLHVQGTKWIGTAADQYPTNAELAVGSNWDAVFNVKNIPIVQIKHHLLGAA